MSEPEKKDAKGDKQTFTRPKMRFKYKLLLIIISIVMMGLLRTGFMFVIIGLLPSIVAHYFDITKHRYLFRTIFASNMTGILPFIGQLLQHGPSNGALQKIMGSGFAWFIIYGSALIGWMLVKICPMIAQVGIAGYHQSQLARFERLQKRIESEWGPEVTQFSSGLDQSVLNDDD